MRLGISLQEQYCLPMPEVIELLADTGFSAISPGWQRGGSFKAAIRRANDLDLTVQSLHGPLRGMPAMWSSDPDTACPITQDLLQSARDCADLGIPLLVVHPWNGVNYTFQPEKLCFEHFDALVTLADKLGICVAFENLEGPEFLDALLARYRSKTVGFCWDSGHELCYAPGWDFLDLYGHRLVMTHLNDNLGVTDPGGLPHGTDDLHLLPFHGLINWENTVSRLSRANKQDILNFELKIRPKGDRCTLDLYSQLPLRQYFRQAYDAACRAVSEYFHP